ncbi:uncharacterized protein LOC134261384 [Saccostrea cucullata]|uniref:uncharacterized protein LOC134261384 n=1 Tax=Saccostrea cuccullata TaxID=36930 RepID=UPI002ED6765A
MARLTEIRKNNEQRLRDNLKERNKKLNSVKSELDNKKKDIEETLKFMENNKSTMSDYGFIDNHKELSKLLSGVNLDFDMKSCEHSMRYSKGDISDEVLENMIGKTLDLDETSLTETSSFKYASDNIEQINKEGEIKHRYNIAAYDMCVIDTGDVYFTNYSNKSISCMSPSGSVSTVISMDPLALVGICQSVDGGLLVTLRDEESERYKSESHSRRLVRHITMTGDVIHEYEYQEDGQTRLFTNPFRVTQNSNSDICVVNSTSTSTGELVIMSPSGRMKSVYRGQNLTKNFTPNDVVSDSLCNILVTDLLNKQIHLLSPDGEFLNFLLTDNEVYHPSAEFLKFLLTENEVNGPIRLSLYKSTLWVGYYEGVAKVFQYRMQYT